jgi:purine-binding chemotaxis protein CheW
MTETGDVIQVVTFRVGTQDFAFEILEVERILRYEKPAGVPKAPAYLEGVLQFEGGAIPVVDLRKRLEVQAGVTDETRLMVLNFEGERIGVLVDEVREVLRIDAGTIAAPPPMVRGLAAAYIAGILASAGRTVVLLNPRKLLSATERISLQSAVR